MCFLGTPARCRAMIVNIPQDATADSPLNKFSEMLAELAIALPFSTEVSLLEHDVADQVRRRKSIVALDEFDKAVTELNACERVTASMLDDFAQKLSALKGVHPRNMASVQTSMNVIKSALIAAVPSKEQEDISIFKKGLAALKSMEPLAHPLEAMEVFSTQVPACEAFGFLIAKIQAVVRCGQVDGEFHALKASKETAVVDDFLSSLSAAKIWEDKLAPGAEGTPDSVAVAFADTTKEATTLKDKISSAELNSVETELATLVADIKKTAGDIRVDWLAEANPKVHDTFATLAKHAKQTICANEGIAELQPKLESIREALFCVFLRFLPS